MQTQWSHVLPVATATEILGESTVLRMGVSMIRFRNHAQSSPKTDVVESEMPSLVAALSYRPPTHAADEFAVPTHIMAGWKRWRQFMSLDKAMFVSYCVPHTIQPAQAGHMGLFDCLCHALSNNNQRIALPDVMIFLAICKQYRQYRAEFVVRQGQSEHEEGAEAPVPKSVLVDASKEEQKIVYRMAQMVFGIYESYMKQKGVVSRDTIHRFMTDIYGEDSFSLPHNVALLDAIFYNADPQPVTSPLPSGEDGSNTAAMYAKITIPESTFCVRCLDTVRPETGSHILLDWVAILGTTLLPYPAIPSSVLAYIDTMNAVRPPLCSIYNLSESRLFEMKRRFHSLVQQQNDMMGTSSIMQVEVNSPAVSNAGGAEPSLNNMMDSASATSPQNRHVITEAAFCYHMSAANEEVGSGGFLPVSMAKLVFRTGYNYGPPSVDRMAPRPTEMPGTGGGWTLFHVLQFGCVAVRIDETQKSDVDGPLLRFIFTMFQQTVAENSFEASSEENESVVDKHILTRDQVTLMILRLLEYAEFRRGADRSPLLEDDEERDIPASSSDTSEDRPVRLSIVVALGLMDPPPGSKPTDSIALKRVVDRTLAHVTVPNQMSFSDFCAWNARLHETTDKEEKSEEMDTSSRRKRGHRLYPLMLDLRFIAAVKFGIPPTLASMEVTLIAEIERRHKRRYPVSDVSRRGPRGTVWNLVDAAWFKTWASHVKAVEGTPEDALDGRGDPRSDRVRGLPRISNTGLLVENGNLSLRPDIRWKQDYELLPPLAWSALQAWYDGGPPIHRSVVKFIANTGVAASPHSATRAPIPTENEIELYPYFVTVYLCDVTSRGEARPFQQNYQLSRVSPILVLLVQLCKELDVSPDSARLWVMGNSHTAKPHSDGHDDSRHDDWILNTELNIVEQRKRRGLSHDNRIVLLLELKDKETGLWPRGIDGKEWSFRDGSAPVPIPSDLGDGIVGLYNIDNTCYLNASIQCLSHTPILREYFTSKAYFKDINRTNPLGYEGRLAQVSAVLINELWKKSYNSTPYHHRRVNTPGLSSPLVTAPALTPKTFKESLGKFNEMFSGNEQHDAQELLAFLLGGLSEDLNRIVEKPYMEAPDSDGRPDSELADIWWSNHLKREMSIIVALFTGQYKSLLTCRTCKYESARFEPFSFLQLPLPEDEHLSVTLIYYSSQEGIFPLKYCVRVKNDGSLLDVLIALAKVLIQDETEGTQIIESLDSDESKSDLDDIYLQRARRMTIVVMREGYIARMAATSWSLQDQQSKDSGELPLMHVYELDSASMTYPDPRKDFYTEKEPSPAFIAVAQRRSELMSRDILHPLAHRVFGAPLLIRINDIDSFSGRDLYDLVARRLKSVVPKTVLRFLSVSPDTSFEERKRPANGVHDLVGRPLHNDNIYRTLTDMEDVAAGPVPRYGFRLRLTTRDGRRCLRCAWYESCIGCLVPDDDEPVIVGDGDSVVVDWHFVVDVATNGFGSRTSVDTLFGSSSTPPPRARTQPVSFKSHSSCGIGLKNGMQAGAVTLEECLDLFSKEEKIPEAYCSKCKDLRVQTKRMSLWRLPPIMIIHLKRFQFNQTMRRKLRELVVFPVEGLDLSRIMATDSAVVSEKQNGTAGESAIEEMKDTGRSEMLYDLYGVVHHQGALSGGHYVASLKSEIDGQWRLFNDAQIYEIHARDVVDPSAYILFYIRRDASKAQLSDYWSVNESAPALSDQDMDHLLKGRSDRCVIS